MVPATINANVSGKVAAHFAGFLFADCEPRVGFLCLSKRVRKSAQVCVVKLVLTHETVYATKPATK